MKNLFLAAFTVLFVSTWSYGQEIIEGELIVRLEKGVEVNTFLGKVNNARSNDVLSLAYPISAKRNIYVFAYDADQVSDWIAFLELPEIDDAHPNLWAQSRNTDPDDPEFNQQWHLNVIDAPEAWDVTTGGLTIAGDTIVIGVFDAGYQSNHPDLAENLWINHFEIPDNGEDDDDNGWEDDYLGFNFKENSDEHAPDDHGTEVVGVMAARGNNNRQGSGVNWNVKTMLLSFNDPQGLPLSRIYQSYYYAADMRQRYNETQGAEGAFVVAFNSSFGIDRVFCDENDFYQMWNDAIDTLGFYGVLSVGAVANGDINAELLGDLPGTCASDYLIAVTATTNPSNSIEGEQKVSSAAFGAESVDLGAPGEQIYTSTTIDTFGRTQGTSFAAPQVTGAIALLYSAQCQEFIDSVHVDPAGMALAVKEFILKGVDPVEDLQDFTTTGGRLNVNNSLGLLQEFCGGKTGALSINNLYPNPTKDILNAEFTFSEFNEHDLSIYNMLGQQLYRTTYFPNRFGENTFEINVSGLSPGIYYLVIENSNGIESKKFMFMR